MIGLHCLYDFYNIVIQNKSVKIKENLTKTKENAGTNENDTDKSSINETKENVDTDEKDTDKSSVNEIKDTVTETEEAVNVDEKDVSHRTFNYFIIFTSMVITVIAIMVVAVLIRPDKKDSTLQNNTTNSVVSTTVSTTVPTEVSSIDYKLLPTNLDTKSFVIERWVYDPHVSQQPTVITYAFNTEDRMGNIKFHHVGRDSISFHHVEDVEPYVTYTKEYKHYDMYITSDVTIETLFTNTQE